jgi:sugar/nucleoside kinase (ribokinase family)
MGLLGADAFGQFMVQAIRARGVDTRAVRQDPALQTGLSIILTQGSDRAILTFPGAIPALRYEHIDLDILDHARHLHLGSYFLLDQLKPDVPRLFREARQRGLTISLDTNFDPQGKWDDNILSVLKEVDVFLPNETELLAISRASSLEAGMRTLAGYGPAVVVKRGAQGAALLSKDTMLKEASMAVEVVDTVGAGDSFDAGYIYGMLHRQPRWDLSQTLRLACICGALSTRAAGGTAAQPTLDEARHYLAKRDDL